MVGDRYGGRLQRLGIQTVEDLLYHFPFRYEDYSIVSKIGLLQEEESVTVMGVVKSFKNVYTRGRFVLQKAIIEDETGELECIWYNQKYLSTILKPGTPLALSGKVSHSSGIYKLKSPDYEIVRDATNLIHTARLVSIYPETDGVSSKWLRGKVDTVLKKLCPPIHEFLPQLILDKYDLISLKDALVKIHFPKSINDIQIAKKRLAFDELFLIQIAATLRRKKRQKYQSPFQFEYNTNYTALSSFIQKLPFHLTDAQSHAVQDILSDLTKTVPMNRLLEGDVGSGKTVVAAVALFACCLSGFQGVVMAPTEILARQQYESIQKFFSSYKYRIGFFSSSTKYKGSKKLDILIGTHSLLTLKKQFGKLGLVIIDEQQRFGVEQRGILRGKGINPHVLTMTATPIPRTIALTLYGDLDLSVIDQMPQGRKRVKTWVVPPLKRDSAYKWITKQIRSSGYKNQVFIICPLIEESENLITVRAVTVEYERLKNHIFSDFSVGLLHGRLKSKEKSNVLQDFLNKKYNILVATTMVEVGIDIPDASIMMIEASDRFGLAQLHQLRGRVGRSETQSYCLLFSDTENEYTLSRLKLLESTFSGPKLAEYDLMLRGAGQVYGVKQHGKMNLKLADFSNLLLINKTKEASELLLKDSSNKRVSYPHLRQKLQKYIIQNIAPD